MPLKHDKSDASREWNIKELIDAGHDPKQAEAIGYKIQRGEDAYLGAAGILYRAGNKVLMLKRSASSSNGGTWGFPAGKLEDGETPKEAALREFWEETGGRLDNIMPLSQNGSFHLFEANGEEFTPSINDEHTDYRYCSPDELPTPLHPGVASALMMRSTMDAASAREYDANNWFEIKDTPLSKVGIFPYLGKSIGAPDKDKVYQVLRPEEELSNIDAINSFRLLPWVDEHTMLGKGSGYVPAEKKGVEGVIGEQVYFDDKSNMLRGNIKLFSESLADVIAAGKRELSAGYRCRYEFTPGIWNGQRYDAIQREIRGNHLALVDRGRMGPEVAVLDQLTFTFDAKELDMAEKELEDKLKKAEDRIAAQDAEMEGLKKDNKAMADKAKDAEEKLAEKEAADKAKDEEEKKKAEDEEAKKASDKKAKDESEKKTEEKLEGMDAALTATKNELADFKKNGLKALQLEAKKRDQLADNLSKHIGTFDHSEMTMDDVAKYGVEKLKLDVPAGQEVAALSGYLTNRPVPRPATISTGMDSSNATQATDYLKKISA